jgi:hypothetical protein
MSVQRWQRVRSALLRNATRRRDLSLQFTTRENMANAFCFPLKRVLPRRRCGEIEAGCSRPAGASAKPTPRPPLQLVHIFVGCTRHVALSLRTEVMRHIAFRLKTTAECGLHAARLTPYCLSKRAISRWPRASASSRGVTPLEYRGRSERQRGVRVRRGRKENTADMQERRSFARALSPFGL